MLRITSTIPLVAIVLINILINILNISFNASIASAQTNLKAIKSQQTNFQQTDLQSINPHAINPQQAAIYRQEGLAARDAGDWAGAMTALRRSVELDPSNPSSRVLLGWTLHLAGQDSQAAEVLQANLRRDPFQGETLNALGIVYLFQDQVWKAIVTHTWAALLQPENEVPFYNLSLGFQRLGLQEWAIATGEYASVLEPYNPHPLLATALAYSARSPLTDGVTAQTVRQLLGATLTLDDRYQDPQFLPQLRQADFSGDQITALDQLFQWYRSPR